MKLLFGRRLGWVQASDRSEVLDVVEERHHRLDAQPIRLANLPHADQ